MEQSTVSFKNVTNLTADGDSVIPQEKKMGAINIGRQVLTTKTRQTRVLSKS